MLRPRATLPLVIMPLLACSPAAPAPSSPTGPAGSSPTPAASSAAAPASSIPHALPYPPTRREAISEVMYGVRVDDPYRWLEDGKSPEVRTWMDAQDAFTRQQLAALPGRDAIAARLRELFYLDSIGIPYHYGSRYFYSRRHADREKTIIYWKDGKNGPEKVLLDPNTWSTDGSQSLGNWSVSWDGKHVAFTIKKNNSDEATMHVLDVATGKRSDVDVIEGAKYAHAQWSPRGDGFYYVFLPTDQAIPVADRPGYAEIRFHRLGADPRTDRLVRTNTGDPKTFLNVQLDKEGRYLFAYVQHGWNSVDVYFRDLRDPKQNETWQPLIVGQDALYNVTAHQDRFYIHTNEGAPHYRVLAADPKRPARSAWTELVAEPKDATIDGLSIVGHKLSLLYLKDVISRLELRTLEGRLDREIPLPGPGTSTVLIGQPDEDDAYFVYNSLTTPSEIHEVSVKRNSTPPKLFARVKVPIEPEKFEVEQRFATSKDGTRVPVFLVHAKGLPRDGSAPTLLYGYGGFQIAMTPTFRASIFPWIERGGVFALSALRGGSEYGEQWHRDGMHLKKQNTFDDFIAVAELLIKDRVTRPDRLAIQGASNGGLLVGAAMTQRPDLFRVVLCGVPLLDMLRYHRFGSGKTWADEYGTSEQKDDFAVLHAYSPYHHVTPGVRYPSLLMVAADSDDRVDPLHARKFTALVQEQSGGGPVLLRIEKNAGHGGAGLVKAAVQEDADQMAFALAQMGLDPTPMARPSPASSAPAAPSSAPPPGRR